MEKIRIWLIVALIISMVLVGLNQIKSQKMYSKLQISTDKLIQQRGHSWLHVNSSAPDSIYFISFGGDTTWYIKCDFQEQ